MKTTRKQLERNLMLAANELMEHIGACSIQFKIGELCAASPIETADDRIRHDWDVDFDNVMSYGGRCGNPLCVECYGVPDYTDEQVAALNADRAAAEAQSMTGCSDTSRMLIELLARRDAHGKAKYGTSLDRTDLSLADWLQHQTEELLDGAGYAQAAKREAEKLLALEAPLRKLIGHLQENPPRIHNPSLRALVDLLQ